MRRQEQGQSLGNTIRVKGKEALAKRTEKLPSKEKEEPGGRGIPGTQRMLPGTMLPSKLVHRNGRELKCAPWLGQVGVMEIAAIWE